MILTNSQTVWEKYIVGYYPAEDEDGYDGIHDGGEILDEKTPKWVKKAYELFCSRQYDDFFTLLKEHNVN